MERINKMISISEITDMGFEDTHIRISKISSDNGEADPKNPVQYLGIQDIRDDNPRPGVYMIIAKQENSENLDIVYIGKAGKGIIKRFREHEAGYKRKLRDGNIPAGIKKLVSKFTSLNINTLEVWYRVSAIASFDGHFNIIADNNYSTSAYSLEEELLIAKYKQFDIINAQIPPGIENENNSSMEHVCKKAKQNSNDKMFNEFSEYYSEWSDEILVAVNNILDSKSDEFEKENLSPKISRYATGLFRGQRVLVFGSLVNTKFKKGTKKYMFTENGKYFIEWPFDNKRISISETLEYFSL